MPPSESSEAFPHHPKEDSFDVQTAIIRVWEAVLSHWLLLFISPLVAVVVVGLYIAIWPKTYTAEVLVMAESEKDAPRDNFYLFWNVFRKDDLETEVALIHSKKLIEQVVIDMDLSYDEIYHPPLSHLTHLWTTSWVGIAYRNVKEVIFPPDTGPYAPTAEELELAKTVLDFKSGVSLEPVPDSHVGALRVRSATARVAEIANHVADQFLEQRRKRFVEEAEDATEALVKQLESTSSRLSVIEKELSDFAVENSLYLNFEQEKTKLGVWVSLKATVIELESELVGLLAKKTQATNMLKVEPEKVLSAEVLRRNPVLQNTEGQIAGLETQRKLVSLLYREDSPEIETIDEQIEALKSMLEGIEINQPFSSSWTKNPVYSQLEVSSKTLEGEISAIEASLNSRRKAIAEMESDAIKLPAIMVRYHEIDRKRAILEEEFKLLEQRRLMAQLTIISAKTAPSSIKIIDYASAPSKPSWPNTKLLFAVAIVVGLLCGLMLAVVLDVVNGRVTLNRLRSMGSDFSVSATLKLYGSQSVFSLTKIYRDENAN